MSKKRVIGFSVGAAIGGIAATQGRISHPLDTLLGAGIWSGIIGGAVVLFEKMSSRSTTQSAPPGASNAEDDIEGFLASLPIAPNQSDGWYPDPARNFRWRRLVGGAWSTEVSDGPLNDPVQSDVLEAAEVHVVNPERVQRDDGIVDKLERLAALRESTMLSDAEFLLAKERLLGRSS